MADARTAILITLDAGHEGGFQKNTHDRANWTGGEVGVGTLVGTNGGITALDMPGADIEHLTLDQKISYYLENFWKKFYSDIQDQAIANKLFDLGVLFGVGTAVKNLQAALGVKTDALFGENTLLATNEDDPGRLLLLFKLAMRAHAIDVAENNPDEAPALPDWLRRINS